MMALTKDEIKESLRESMHYQLLFLGEALRDLWYSILNALDCDATNPEPRIEDVLDTEVEALYEMDNVSRETNGDVDD